MSKDTDVKNLIMNSSEVKRYAQNQDFVDQFEQSQIDQNQQTEMLKF